VAVGVELIAVVVLLVLFFVEICVNCISFFTVVVEELLSILRNPVSIVPFELIFIGLLFLILLLLVLLATGVTVELSIFLITFSKETSLKMKV